MRRGLLQRSAVARTAAHGAVAAAIAAALHLWRERASVPANLESPAKAGDPLASELARCQALGKAAEDDAVCEATWAANRRRFFSGAADRPIIVRPARTKGE